MSDYKRCAECGHPFGTWGDAALCENCRAWDELSDKTEGHAETLRRLDRRREKIRGYSEGERCLIVALREAAHEFGPDAGEAEAIVDALRLILKEQQAVGAET